MRGLDETSPNRIPDDVTRDTEGILFHTQRTIMVSGHPEPAGTAIDLVRNQGQHRFDPLHETRERSLLAQFDQRMQMIRHQHPAQHLGIDP